MEILECREDISIDRDDPVLSGMAVVRDSEGDILFYVPMMWSDDAIYTALDIANNAYGIGYNDGASNKLSEIKKILGFNSH